MNFARLAVFCLLGVYSELADAANDDSQCVSPGELQALEERIIHKFEKENRLLLQKVKWLQQDLKRERLKRGGNRYGTAVAFQADLSGDKEHLNQGQIILFNNVITNVGDAYNPNNGLFTCPVSGIYVFHSHIVAGSSEYVEAEFNVNGQFRPSKALSDHVGIGWDQGSMSIVLELTKGDLVGVKINYPPGVNTLHGKHFCTFAGYMIDELEQPIQNVIG